MVKLRLSRDPCYYQKDPAVEAFFGEDKGEGCREIYGECSMNNWDNLLFSQQNLTGFLHAKEQYMLQEIDKIDGNRLLNTSVNDWCDYFEQKYKVDILVLKEDRINVDQQETKMDVSQDIDRLIRDRSMPFYVKGTTIIYYVPFEGDPELLRWQPSTFTHSPPCGIVEQNEIVLTYTQTDHNAESVKSNFERDLSNIRQYLQWIKNDASAYNGSIRTKAENQINTRRQKLLNDQGLVASLGFPLKRREGAPQTFVVPTVLRKLQMPMPSNNAPFTPEPTLDMSEYENILTIILNMVKVMESSPQAFRGMCEEDLRQHFLVQLNGQYYGQATGETFNFQGKTDILIRHVGKNIFIAECKFWDGPESLKRAIDQLLGYVAWRDTKTALLLFNRNKNFSSVLSKIPEVIIAHPNFKRESTYNSESGFRYVLHHKDDKNRDIILTVLAFEVPV
jgi:hypothetical protein